MCIRDSYYEGREINPKEVKELDLLIKTGVLCNNAILQTENGVWRVIGDTTEGALLTLGLKAGISREDLEREYVRVSEVPFDSERKMMSTVHKKNEVTLVFSKGAVEKVIERSSYIIIDGEIKALDERLKKEILNVNASLAGDGFRVLAFAYKELTRPLPNVPPGAIEEDLIFIGLAAMIDPPREEAIEAVKKCKKAGIKVIMVTGDHKLTAMSIGRELGLFKDGDLVLTGRELDDLTDEELYRIIDKVSIFARVSPSHKLRIVKILKRKGYIVAMTGDGINDAPSVKKADVGVSMGITGTDVTKEASDIVLTDDNFASIVAAIEEGRLAFENIKKYIMYLLSCNVGEVLLMLAATLMNLPLPLLATQILLINLTTDGLPAIALSADPGEKGIMERPPRPPTEGVFTSRVKVIIIAGGALMAILGTPIFGWFVSLSGVNYARTMILWFLTLFEMFRAFACRSETETSIEVGITSNKFLVLSVLSSIVITLFVIYTPFFQILFDTVPVSLNDLVLMIPLALLSLIAIDSLKKLWKT